MDEYELLVKKGNIGIYNSCEVTELVIMESSDCQKVSSLTDLF